MARKKIKTLQATTSFLCEVDEPLAQSREVPSYRVPLDEIEGEDPELYDMVYAQRHVHGGERVKANDPIVKGREALFEEVEEE